MLHILQSILHRFVLLFFCSCCRTNSGKQCAKRRRTDKTDNLRKAKPKRTLDELGTYHSPDDVLIVSGSTITAPYGIHNSASINRYYKVVS